MSLPRESTFDRKKKWIRLLYLGQFATGLSKISRAYNSRPALYNSSTFRHLFPSPKDPFPKFSKNEFIDCPALIVLLPTLERLVEAAEFT